MINGQIPGPTIEANWGDDIQVTVTNKITGPEEGTSLHWHGLLQNKTPWFDGVPSVQQCPIAPGSTFTYTFNAGLYGTSWYHSHYSAQYADGLSGPMIIHGCVKFSQAYGSFLTFYSPSNAPYDIDLGPVFLVNRVRCGRCGSADAFRLTGTTKPISLSLSPKKPITHLQPRNHTQTTTSSTAKAISTAPKFQ